MTPIKQKTKINFKHRDTTFLYIFPNFSIFIITRNEKICNFYEKSVDRISHKEYYGEGGRNKPHKRREEDNKWQIWKH